MVDSAYFTCLGVTAVCALLAPIYTRRVLFGKATPKDSFILITASVIGFACSLPFGKTHEMPWLPLVAGCYFAVVILTGILLGISEILQALKSRDREGRRD